MARPDPGTRQPANTKQQPTTGSSTRRRSSITDCTQPTCWQQGREWPECWWGSERVEPGVLDAIAEPSYGEVEEPLEGGSAEAGVDGQ